MKFVSVDGKTKRVAHTSGVIEMIGREPVDLPIYDPETEKGHKGLMECAMAAGCIPYNDQASKDAAQAEADKVASEKEAFDKAVEEAVEARLAAERVASAATPKPAEAAVVLEPVATPVAETAAPAAETSAVGEAASAPVAKGKVIKG